MSHHTVPTPAPPPAPGSTVSRLRGSDSGPPAGGIPVFVLGSGFCPRAERPQGHACCGRCPFPSPEGRGAVWTDHTVLVRRLSADAGCSHPAVVNTDAVIAESPLSLLWGKSRRWGCGPPRFTRHQEPQGFRRLPVLVSPSSGCISSSLAGYALRAPCARRRAGRCGHSRRGWPEGVAGGGGRRGWPEGAARTSHRDFAAGSGLRGSRGHCRQAFQGRPL